MIAVIAILGGAVLGTRYKVLCLVPTTATGIAAVAILDFLNEVSVRSTLKSALVLAVGLQIGYLIGYLIEVIVRSVLLFAARRQHDRTGARPRAAGADF